MMTSTASLPEGFEVLEPFVAEWAITGLVNRAGRRDRSTAEERKAFYDAFKGMVEPVLMRLDGKSVKEFDGAEHRLMALLLSYVHVALAVEIRGDGEALHLNDRRHMVITHAPSEEILVG